MTDTIKQSTIETDEYRLIKFNLANVCPIEMVDIPERVLETKTTRNPDTGEMTMTMSTLQGFKLSKCEITQIQWETVMGTNPSYHQGDFLPVENVSYREIVLFVNELNKVMGTKYYLPAENQWQYAAAGCRTDSFDCYAGTKDKSELHKYAWYADNSSGETHRVGTRLPNTMGLFDMSGNVSELCSLCQISEDDKFIDENLPDSIHVILGGSWASEANNCLLGNRKIFHVDFKSKDLGFRLAQEP